MIQEFLNLQFIKTTDDANFDKLKKACADVVKKVSRDKAKISAYDPAAQKAIAAIFPSIKLCENPYEALTDADALMILTEWHVFRTVDMQKVKKLMASKNIFDGRNIYDVNNMKKLGFSYYSIGR